uniref:Uncharacterized protein n=1 Tax=Arundo donax TaxID=35708 RepID=A0A0A9EV78_ARUDO
MAGEELLLQFIRRWPPILKTELPNRFTCPCNFYGMTCLAGRAAAGQSGNVERLVLPTPTTLGFLESRGTLGDSRGRRRSPAAASMPSVPPAATRLGLLRKVAHQRVGVGEREPVREVLPRKPRNTGVPGAGTSGSGCRRPTYSGSALTCVAALRSAAHRCRRRYRPGDGGETGQPVVSARGRPSKHQRRGDDGEASSLHQCSAIVSKH